MQGGEPLGQPTSWPDRVAGFLLLLLGVANAAFGVLGLATGLVHLTPGTAGTLLTLGLATAALGMLVWRGSRPALMMALVVFGLLLVAQLADAVTADSDGAAARLAVLAVLVAALAVAGFRRPPSGRR